MRLESPFQDGDRVPWFPSREELFEAAFPGLPFHIYALADLRSRRDMIPLAMEPMRRVVERAFEECLADGCEECEVSRIMLR